MSWTLPRKIGTARALDLLLTNRPLAAEEALTCGLASRVVDDGTCLELVASLARDIAAGPTTALASAKALVRDGVDRTLAEQLDVEAASIARHASSPEGIEGAAAFVQKRRAEYHPAESVAGSR